MRMRAIRIKIQYMGYLMQKKAALRTTLREEIQEEELDAGWYGAKTNHPSPAARDVREACVNS